MESQRVLTEAIVGHVIKAMEITFFFKLIKSKGNGSFNKNETKITNIFRFWF